MALGCPRKQTLFSETSLIEVWCQVVPTNRNCFWSLHFSEKGAQRNSEQFPGSGALRSLFWCPIVNKNVDFQKPHFLPKKIAGRRRRNNFPNLASPSPNVRRDKISRSGKPLTLIYIYIYRNIYIYMLDYSGLYWIILIFQVWCQVVLANRNFFWSLHFSEKRRATQFQAISRQWRAEISFLVPNREKKKP